MWCVGITPYYLQGAVDIYKEEEEADTFSLGDEERKDAAKSFALMNSPFYPCDKPLFLF